MRGEEGRGKGGGREGGGGEEQEKNACIRQCIMVFA